LPLKKIYLVRHGQTKYNKLGIVQGRGIDAPLNDTGLAQADQFFHAYKTHPFDKVYTSLLKRTYQSVRSFIETGIPHEYHAGFDEISWGKHEGAEASEERNGYFKEIVSLWNEGKTSVKIEGGESPEDVALRQKVAMEIIIKAGDENVLVCMHGRAIRILLCQLLGHPLSYMDNFEHSNLGLYVLNYAKGRFDIEITNSTDHLED
jgi:probable phosphoglycerate mutase